MAGLDEKTHVGIHETDRHRHVLSVGQNNIRIRSPLLDEGENVVLNGD